MSADELMWKQVSEAVERALCNVRKHEQLEDVMANADEAAIILGISRGSVYAGIKNGTIPAVFVNRRILIPIASLARMIVDADERAKAKVEQGSGI